MPSPRGRSRSPDRERDSRKRARSESAEPRRHGNSKGERGAERRRRSPDSNERDYDRQDRKHGRRQRSPEDSHTRSRGHHNAYDSRERGNSSPDRYQSQRNKGDGDTGRWRGGGDETGDDRGRRGDRWRVDDSRGSRWDRRDKEEHSGRDEERRDRDSRHPTQDGGDEPRRKGRSGIDAASDENGKAKGEKSEVAEAAAADEDGPASAPVEAPAPIVRKAPVAGRAGGVYIPPFKLAAMMAEVSDKAGPEYQRMTWDALRKSINGLINKVNTSNIKNILPELFGENLVRGRGLFCRSLMKAQMASPGFTPVYAALLAVVNTKFPEIGDLLLRRVILQFRRAYKRNDKPVTLAVTRFLAHLINQGVAHEVLALELLILLLEQPSDDSVEVAVDFTKEVGAYLQDVAAQGLHSVFERFRAILHEGEIDKRVQFMIEGMFATRKAGFATSGHVAVPAALDLVEAEDQVTHEISLDEPLEAQLTLDVFKFDPEYELHEREYAAISREILGEDEDDEEGEGVDDEDDAGADEDSEEDDEEGGGGGGGGGGARYLYACDNTQGPSCGFVQWLR